MRAVVLAWKQLCAIVSSAHTQLMEYADEGFSPPESFDWSTFGSYQRKGQVLAPGRSGFNKARKGAYRPRSECHMRAWTGCARYTELLLSQDQWGGHATVHGAPPCELAVRLPSACVLGAQRHCTVWAFLPQASSAHMA
jgi:hypothetical protein